MIVPTYWAEGRARHRSKGRQVTLRRFGWSDESQEDAQAKADARANEALARVLGGEELDRHEPKLAYNGADGVPIREEIVDRFGDVIITRNLYGARCLNTPDVLFADIDFQQPVSGRFMLGTLISWIVFSVVLGNLTASAVGWVVGIFGLFIVPVVAAWWRRLRSGDGESSEKLAKERVERFLKQHTDWRVRLYRTPVGMRVLVIHRTFDPTEPEVEAFFGAIDVDPLYARMCENQRCFRARLTAKPWRIGIAAHMKPRPGVWPVREERLPERARWIAEYERVANGFAACRFLEELGEGTSHSHARRVQALHDELSRATSTLPLA